MPSVTNALKKMTGKSDDKKTEEPTFSIQPHPAVRILSSYFVGSVLTSPGSQQTNDPADLMPEQTGGLASNPNAGAFHARDPHVPSQQVMAGLEQPAVRPLPCIYMPIWF
ncbi:hypothetical protein B0H19DRAFT_1157395 [Mycena capillaripes]|nr:hypothetical protein B0H19DRAFT_1157395 [Mycena capillaripes]